jgi:hypothetical protein
MSLDKIIVIVLAVGFFGGVILLAIKSREGIKQEGPAPSSPDQNNESVALPLEPRKKERRKSKK